MIIDLAKEIEEEVLKITDNYEIFLKQSKNIELNSEKDQLNFAKERVSEGIGIRVLKNNKMGFAYTSDLSKIKETTEQALSNTKLSKADENYGFAKLKKEIKVKGIYDKKIEDLAVDESIDFLNNMIETSKNKKCDITSAGFYAGASKIAIVNSNGVAISDKETDFSAGVSVNAGETDNLSTAYDSISSRKFDLDGEKLAEEVCNLALNSLNGSNIETNDYNVILDYHAAIGLLSTFTQAFSSENVQRQRSILKDKIGKEIVSSNLSIINDSTLEGGLGSQKCDDEGVISKKTTLVEKGVLKSFLYDIYTANKADTQSTSNGYRSSYSNTPKVSPSNLIYNFNEETKIDEINNGILVSSVLGAHTANPISGDFSVEANNAFKIENGEIKTPIKKAMASGNIFELLKSVEKVESPTKQYGPYIIPKLLVHNLRIIGQEN